MIELQTDLATKGGIYVSERDRRILQLLEEKKPAGIITVNPTLHARWRIIEDFDLDIPSVTVSAASGLRLLNNPGAVAQMKIEAHRSPSHTDNVVARLQGDIPQRIVLCAHYDSKVDTPGAYDNAAGVGVDARGTDPHRRGVTPKGGALAKMLTPFRMGAGGIIGSGRQYMSWGKRQEGKFRWQQAGQDGSLREDNRLRERDPSGSEAVEGL